MSKKVSKHQFLKKHKKNIFHPAKQEYPEITKKNMSKKSFKTSVFEKTQKKSFSPGKTRISREPRNFRDFFSFTLCQK